MFSADRDISPEEVGYLVEKHAARFADWESGAIAWVAKRNQTPLIIPQGVSDLVSQSGGESYGEVPIYKYHTRKIITNLASQRPWWIDAYLAGSGTTSPA